MSYEYSDPKRESAWSALPDLEIWESAIYIMACDCGDYEVSEGFAGEFSCPSCDAQVEYVTRTNRAGWFFWFCFPGCLPDGDETGPFASFKLALATARKGN